MTEQTKNINDALKDLTQSIRHWEQKYHRQTDSVTLMAVSKTKPAEQIQAAFDAGARVFGENYPDEAIAKTIQLSTLDCEWHFIGAIQSRKATKLAKHFDWVHSVDRLKVASKLSDAREAATPLQICLQVNIDAEASKSGLAADEVLDFANECANLPNLQLRGLMAIPKPSDSIATQRDAFARVRALFNQCKTSHPEMDTLSMGMSGDIEAAIAEGATIVRVGTAIFGSRAPKK